MNAPTLDQLSALPNLGSVLFTRFTTYVLRIDILIADCDAALEQLQPAKPGRLRVEWWKDGDSPLTSRQPHVVIWNRLRNSTWTAVMVGEQNLPQRAKRSGPFAQNAEEVRAVLKVLAELLKKRRVCVQTLKKVRAAMSQLVEGNDANLEALEHTLRGIVASAGPTAS